RSRNPLVVEFEHWVSLARDVVSAGSVWTAISYVMLPPGWRADGASETTKALRQQNLSARRIAPVGTQGR
ncbi:MAG: fatty acid hydroxylase, partial [Caballeronia sp.]|nr:fatty acid hydroxylase [Caballeronia sp.]